MESCGLNLIVAHGALSCDCKLILQSLSRQDPAYSQLATLALAGRF